MFKYTIICKQINIYTKYYYIPITNALAQQAFAKQMFSRSEHTKYVCTQMSMVGMVTQCILDIIIILIIIYFILYYLFLLYYSTGIIK